MCIVLIDQTTFAYREVISKMKNKKVEVVAELMIVSKVYHKKFTYKKVKLMMNPRIQVHSDDKS